jgi:hypothetical protein
MAYVRTVKTALGDRGADRVVVTARFSPDRAPGVGQDHRADRQGRRFAGARRDRSRVSVLSDGQAVPAIDRQTSSAPRSVGSMRRPRRVATGVRLSSMLGQKTGPAAAPRVSPPRGACAFGLPHSAGLPGMAGSGRRDANGNYNSQQLRTVVDHALAVSRPGWCLACRPSGPLHTAGKLHS